MLHVADADRRAEFLRQRFGPRQTAVGKPDFLRARLDERGQDGAGAAAGAEDDDGSIAGMPVRMRIGNAGDEAVGIGVAAFEFALGTDDDRVHRADPARDRIDEVDQLQCRLFVRDGQIAAGEIEHGQGPQRLFERVLLDFERHIAAGEPVMLQPKIMQFWRTRMHDRPAHDAGDAEISSPATCASSSPIQLSRAMMWKKVPEALPRRLPAGCHPRHKHRSYRRTERYRKPPILSHSEIRGRADRCRRARADGRRKRRAAR